MNESASPTHAGGATEYRLQVSRYDQVSSMLIALLVLVGVVVSLMLIVWLTTRIFLGQAAVPVELVELGEGEGLVAGGMELEGPIEEVIGMETELDEPAVRETLAAIADAVGAQAALLEDPALTDEMNAGRGGGSRGQGRVPGFGTGSGSGVARRWEVRFIEGNTVQTYARQLDYFKIELGVVMPGNQMHYAHNLAKPRPDTRLGPPDQKRYYLTWLDGDLVEAEHELLSRAGIQSRGRIVVKYLTPQLESQLYNMEKRRAAGVNEKPEDVRKTWFRVITQGDGYAFEVADQSYK